jgi:hypothetical protein
VSGLLPAMRRKIEEAIEAKSTAETGAAKASII